MDGSGILVRVLSMGFSSGEKSGVVVEDVIAAAMCLEARQAIALVGASSTFLGTWSR